MFLITIKRRLMGKYRSPVLQRWLFDVTMQRCVRVNHYTFSHLQKRSMNSWMEVERNREMREESRKWRKIRHWRKLNGKGKKKGE